MYKYVNSLKVGISVLIVIVSFCPLAFGGDNFGKISDAEWQMGAPENYPEAGAIILLDSASIEVTVDHIEINRHKRIKILTPAGVDEAGDMSIWYNKEYDKLKGLKAHTITPDGKKHNVEKSGKFEREIRYIKEQVLSFPAVQPGVILEYKYTIRSKNFRYLKPWYFQSDLYTMKSILTVSLGTGFSYNIQYMNVPHNLRKPVEQQALDPDRSFGTVAYIKIFTWTMENLPPIKKEPYMSSENDYRSGMRLQIYSFENQYNSMIFVKNWTELGEEFQQYWLEDYCNKEGDIKKLAIEVTSGLTTPEEKSEAIYNYVKENYKVSEEYKNLFFVHDKISKLLEHKFGSAEGMNVLLAMMHNAVDIQAWPVLISTRDHGRIDTKSPDLRQFNYMITFVQMGEKWEFLDTSNRLLSYGLLPPQCLTEAGFLIDGKESSLVKVVIKDIESSRLDKTSIYIDSEGGASCSTSCCFTGYYASMYVNRYEEDKSVDFIDDYFISKTDATCDIGTHSCYKDSLDRFMVKLCYSSEDMVGQLDENLIVKPITYAFRNNPFKSARRFAPVDFTYPFKYQSETEMIFEDSVQEFVLPEDVSFAIESATFDRKCSLNDSGAVIITVLNIRQPLVPTHKYGGLREFFEKVTLAGEDEVTAVLSATQ